MYVTGRRCNPTTPLSQTSLEGELDRSQAGFVGYVLWLCMYCGWTGCPLVKDKSNCPNMLLERNIHTLVDFCFRSPNHNNARVYIFLWIKANRG